jgi:L-fuconolactonase
MRIDSHQHFWDYTANAADYVWMTGEYGALRRDFLPADLAPWLREAGVDGTVTVQAREMVSETDWLLGLADTTPWVKGVVGWIDICAPGSQPLVERYSAHAKLKGLRLLIHDRPDPEFAISPAHVRGIGWLAGYGLTYDLLLKPLHLRPATRLVDRFPGQRFVVDHMAKPDITSGELSPWREDIRELARRPNVCCKVSGLVTTADWDTWSAAQFAPYLDVVLEAFGPARLMVGSDWPVCTCAADYGRSLQVTLDWSRLLSPTERADVLGDTASRFYGLGS